MMIDCALEPRSTLAANVAKMKNRRSHDLQKHLGKFDPFKCQTDLLLKTAYGQQGLGNPLLGNESNVDYINARML